MSLDKIVVIDGNDGTGKSTIVSALKKLGYEVKDRGIPSLMTDNKKVEFCKDEIYIILDAPVEICRQRLLNAGKNIEEKYHTLKDLNYYQQRFLEVAQKLPHCFLVDASGGKDEVLSKVLKIITGPKF